MMESSDAGGGHGRLSRSVVEMVAGLSAGSMATLIVHPLDIVKTRMQIHRTGTTPSSATAQARLTTVSVIKSLWQTERPIAALYRGLTPNLMGNATSWASFFFFKSRAERAIALLKQPPLKPSSPEPRGTAAATASLEPADFFAASLAAGVATQVITNPIWVIKTRMLSSDRSAAGAYPSMWSGAVRLFREEGVLGFYRGLGVGMLAVSHGAVQFAVYDPARRMYLKRRDRKRHQTLKSGDNESVSNEATIVLSTVSKLVAGVITYPLQVLRSRLQNYDAEERFGKGARGVVRQLWREEGARGFYRGMVPGVIRVLPATWVTFLVYENVKYYLYLPR
ncbi:mitochondrial carrier domain-containing protein [Apodospora peruviana]|uniref:Mitochondrial carrier domain-containing protein n=1 Tax=Apodospora peruviana TaxID=516989 RepID=A0AAE0IKQ6_9PEZI|nr:mitochondrial carrier domain-containing protein [Apodospora peruviana]